MQKFQTLQDAIELARFAHRNQLDKSGAPYIEHPLRVLAAVQAQGARPYVQMAAVLHDVTEDTTFTNAILLELGFSPAVPLLIDLLDRDVSENHFHAENYGRDLSTERNRHGDRFYISLGPDAADEFYYANIRANPDALMIKLADIADNTQEWRLAYLPDETQNRLHNKYAAACVALLG